MSSSGADLQGCRTLGQLWCLWGRQVGIVNVLGSNQGSNHLFHGSPMSYARWFFGNNYSAPKSPNRGSGIVKCSIEKSHADLVMLRVDCRKKLRVVLVWGMRWSHRNFGKSDAIPARMDKKCALMVRIARSEALHLWMSGGTSCYLIPKSSVIRCLQFELSSFSRI